MNMSNGLGRMFVVLNASRARQAGVPVDLIRHADSARSVPSTEQIWIWKVRMHSFLYCVSNELSLEQTVDTVAYFPLKNYGVFATCKWKEEMDGVRMIRWKTSELTGGREDIFWEKHPRMK